MRQNHNWNDDERDIIRRDYKHTRKSRQELAARLGVTEYGVAGQISNMGIAKSDDRRPWTPQEKRETGQVDTPVLPSSDSPNDAPLS